MLFTLLVFTPPTYNCGAHTVAVCSHAARCYLSSGLQIQSVHLFSALSAAKNYFWELSVHLHEPVIEPFSVIFAKYLKLLPVDPVLYISRELFYCLF